MSAAERAGERLFHDLFSPPDVLAVRQRVRALAREHLEPIAPAVGQRDEVEDGFPRAAFDLMAGLDLYSIPFAAPHGAGLEHPATATAATVEELAYTSNSLAAVFDVHCILAGHAVSMGPPPLVAEWLPKICAGSVVGAFATSEPGASSDLSPAAVQTAARRDGDDYVVDGAKRWITNSVAAAFVVTLCRTGESELSLLLVRDRAQCRQPWAPRALRYGG